MQNKIVVNMKLLNNLLKFTKFFKQLNNTISYKRNYCTNSKKHEEILHEVNKQEIKDQGALLQKALSIAVIGVPNAGKSTFINNIINHRVCPTSSKVHTTRKANKAIYTTGQTQLIFYDTPGLVTQKEIKKHSLEQSFKSSYRHAIQNADMIAVLHDASNIWTRRQLHSTVLDSLKSYPNLPSILILNKIDSLKSKRVTLELIKILTNNTLTGLKKQIKSKEQVLQEKRETPQDRLEEYGTLHQVQSSWSYFNEVFLVSSITGNGLTEVHDYLIDASINKPWQYPSEAFTDETPEQLIVESVRARLLDYLPQEIPYSLKPSMEFYSVEKNTIYAAVEVMCPTRRIERLICGKSNGRLKQITERVTSDLVETFGKPISFTIATKSKEKAENNTKL